jgi:hypothetical protein
MEKSLKTLEIVNAYQLLGNAKYNKLEDADQLKVWRLSRLMKPIAKEAEEAQQDALSSLIPDEFRQKVQKAQEYAEAKKAGIKDKDGLPMTDKEYVEYLTEFRKYNILVGKAFDEVLQKEVTIEYEPLSEDTVGLLVTCNEWPMDKALEHLEWLIG